MPSQSPRITILRKQIAAFLLVPVAALLLTQCQGQSQSSPDTPSSNALSDEAAQPKPAPVDPNAVPAPEFVLSDLQGGTVSLSQYRGHVVLVDFWGTWCGPCRRSIPDLKYLYQTHQSDGFDVLGVALEKRGLENLVSYVASAQIPYPVLVGDGKVVAKYGGIRSVPTAFLIGRDGTIRNRFVGVQPRSVLEKAILSLLAEPPA